MNLWAGQCTRRSDRRRADFNNDINELVQFFIWYFDAVVSTMTRLHLRMGQ